MAQEHTTGPYGAHIEQDPELGTLITLSYTDQQHPTHSLSLGIAPEMGSNMFRFRVGEHDLIYCDRQLLARRAFTGDFVLWPLPNRIRDKRYSYQGHEYSLAAIHRPSGNDVLIHGLVFDRVWQFTQPMVTDDAASVTTFVEMRPGDPFYESYPFESRLSLTYRLTHTGVAITYNVENTGTHDLPFGFALHPYFATLSSKNDTRVSIPAREVMEADSELLPTGRLLDVGTTMYAMFDLRQPVPVSHLKLDHVYTELSQDAAVISYEEQALQLRISATEDFTHCVIYTGTPDDPFLCLEHQTCSTDAVNLHTQGKERSRMAHLLEVRPGETSTGTLHYTIHFIQEKQA